MAFRALCGRPAADDRLPPPHKTGQQDPAIPPGKAARGAGRGQGGRSQPEPAVVSQPPGRSRWDRRASRGFAEASPARPSRVFWGLCRMTFCGGDRGPPAFAHTLCEARRGMVRDASAVAGVPRPPLPLGLARSGGGRAAWARQRARRRRRRRRSGARPGPQGAPSAPALTFEDRAELLQGHGPQRRRSESA